MTEAPLLPAEAALLVEPKRSSAPQCIQAALLTLLGRGHIAIEEEGRLIKHRYLRLRPGDGEPLPRHLATVKNALDVHTRFGMVRSDQSIRSLQKAFGNDYRKYVHDILAPPLISRGLLKREERRFLGLIPYFHYERTLAGEAKARPLIRLLDEAGGIKKLIRTDPDRAIRIAQMAGVLLVLSPAAKAQIPKLKALMADRSGDGGGAYFHAEGSSDESDWQFGVDFGSFDFSAEVGGWLDAIGFVGAFTGDDGGGDGSGDGGGGGD
jgi:hypothetical protein